MSYSFKNLFIWQESVNLYIQLHQDFAECKYFFFRDQILRATLSISNNIAECQERKSKAQQVQFYYYAKGSSGEVLSMIYIANKIDLLTTPQVIDYSKTLKLISAGIYKLISTCS